MYYDCLSGQKNCHQFVNNATNLMTITNSTNYILNSATSNGSNISSTVLNSSGVSSNSTNQSILCYSVICPAFFDGTVNFSTPVSVYNSGSYTYAQ